MKNNTYNDVIGIESYQLNVERTIINLNDVMYIFKMRKNLLSIPALTEKEFEVFFIILM